jgi:hypothetical protein
VPGTYTVVVDPASTYTGNNTLKLHDVPADTIASITPGGSGVGLTTTVPGQNGRLTFTGAANDRVSVKANPSTIATTTLSILDAAGVTLASTLILGSGFLDTQTLPAAGQYSIFVDPYLAYTGSMTVTLYDVPADLTGTISLGGSAVPLNITTPGQNGWLTFSGTSGQRVSLTMTAGALTSGSAVILNPDQSPLIAGGFGNGTSLLGPVTLPSSGTFSIAVDPLSDSTGTITLTLNSVPADVTGSITPGGSPVQVTLTGAGQNGQLTFTGTAGQRISLGVSGGPDGTVTIRKPDQTALASTTMWFFPSFVDAVTLPTTGTYTLVIDPSAANTGSVTLTLYDVPADFTGTVTVGGSAQTVNTTTPGQNASLTFSGTASQQVTVHVTGNTMGLVFVSLLKPDGTTLTTWVSSSSSFDLPAQTLPTTGTYTIAIDPFQASTGTMNVQVTNP